MAILEFGTRENVVSLENRYTSSTLWTLDIFPSFVLAAWKLKVIPLFMGQRPIGQTCPINLFGLALTNPGLKHFKFQCPSAEYTFSSLA